VGQVHPHVEAKVVDGQGHILPVGVVGELWTRGYNVMQGYWGNAEQTKDSIEDGWMKTGDLAVIDSEGYCSIVGRQKDMLIRGGENVYPREVEEIMLSVPGIEVVEGEK
jgi:fatty-acyl-CoA synthase